MPTKDPWALDDVADSLPEDFDRTTLFYDKRLEDMSRRELYAVIDCLTHISTQRLVILEGPGETPLP